MTNTDLIARSLVYDVQRSSRSTCRSLVYMVFVLVLGFSLVTLFVFFSTSGSLEWQKKARNGDSQQLKMDVSSKRLENTDLALKLYNKVRVLCWIMTSPDNHLTRAIHVKRTWGKRCNKLLFMSSTEDETIETIALNVSEGRNYLWAKTKEAFKYINEHHLQDADWFLKADDDTYIIVENLRLLLYPYSPETPIYFGCKFKPFVKQGYMSGGAGYVLSKEAVRRFVERAIPNPEICSVDSDGAEDIEIGVCLENVDVIAGDSRDHQGRGRFFPFAPEYHLLAANTEDTLNWYWQYKYYDTKEGPDCCPNHAISFHYIPPNQMYAFDYLIYQLWPYGVAHATEALPDKVKVDEIEPPVTDAVTEISLREHKI